MVFFNSYLIAPLVPSLARELHASENLIGLAVPAYLIPYGISTLFYGPLSDRIGRKNIILTLLSLAVVTPLLTASVQTAHQLIVLRMVAGMSAGIVPVGLALIGDLFPYEKRGNAMGWIFGAIAGGVAFGSTFGAALNPLIGWRWELVGLAAANVVILCLGFRYRSLLDVHSTSQEEHSIAATFSGYFNLLKDSRALRTYGIIFMNGMFHSGVFAWLGLYFARRYQLGDYGIGLALLGYGLPGMLLAPALGRFADRHGRSRMIPSGIFLSACCAILLALPLPLIAAALVVTALSFGFDMSHPLMVGIVSTFSPNRRGLAMGLNAFILFMGFGLGSLLFQLCMQSGLGFALTLFAITEALVAAIGLMAFAHEKSPTIQAR